MKITTIIPTQGRDTLERTLESFVRNASGNDECFVVVDTHGMDTDTYVDCSNRIMEFGPRVWPFPYDAGHNCFGHCQLNRGLDFASDSIVTFNDDDDIFAEGIFDVIRKDFAEDSDGLHVYKFITPWRGILPNGNRLYEGGVGGHCLTFRGDKPRGQFTCRYAGDWDFIESTLAAWQGNGTVYFHDEVIAITRPRPEDIWWD